MWEKIIEEVVLESKVNQRPFLADIRYKQDKTQKPVIIFVHGFKGFKDWGHFNLLADKFAEQGFVFIKFNFSHNGTTIQSPLDFDDLEAFAENNFTKEIEDITTVVDYIYSKENVVPTGEFDLNRLFIIGHSRGGGISIVKASEDNRIKGIATWAALSSFKLGTSKESIEEWKNAGVIYAENARTNQKMPMNFQLFEDYASNPERFNPLNAMSQMNIPIIVLHGDMDKTVPVSHAQALANVNDKSTLHIIKGANHVFGGTHPFNDGKLHQHTLELLNKTLTFFKNL
ncbi:MAG TPA: dienelactone hydrolase family protein [Fulvivirga sp.]|nr:dienelactone hydrolase family protein [Fulvivirga sp.]